MQETPVQFLGWEDLLEKGYATHSSILGLPLWLSWQRICLQRGRPGFNPWVGKITWRRERLPAPVFWPGESGLGHKELDRTEPLSLSLWKQMQKVFFPITLSTLVSSYQNLREAILDKHSQNIITSRDYLKLLRVYLKALFFSFSLRDHVRLKLQRDQVAHLISKAQEKSQMLLESQLTSYRRLTLIQQQRRQKPLFARCLGSHHYQGQSPQGPAS